MCTPENLTLVLTCTSYHLYTQPYLYQNMPGQILDAMLGAAPTGPTVLPVATVAPVVPTTPAPIISPNKPQCAVETWSGGSGDVFRSTDSAG